jgi:hypothetical protein
MARRTRHALSNLRTPPRLGSLIYGTCDPMMTYIRECHVFRSPLRNIIDLRLLDHTPGKIVSNTSRSSLMHPFRQSPIYSDICDLATCVRVR